MNTSIARSAWLGVLFAAAMCTGCSGTPPPSDIKSACAAMETALNAWQNGETQQSLQSRDPPIHFSDLHWDKGFRLTKYTIESEQPYGLGIKMTVKLSMQSKEGTQQQATTIYTAETNPKIIIVPEF